MVGAANPQAVVAVVGPGEQLPASVTTQAAILDAADDAFIAGLRAATLVGCCAVLSALVLAWITFPRRDHSAAET